MDRAGTVFAALFLALPLALLVAAMAIPGPNLGLALTSLFVLVTGFVLGLGFTEP